MSAAHPFGPGDAADFLPLTPTPFTWSLFQEGWRHARELIARVWDQPLPQEVWQLDGGTVITSPEWMQALAGALHRPTPVAAAALGVPEEALPSRPRGRGLLGLFRRASGTPWAKHMALVTEEIGRVARWERSVAAMRWSQADILQVMEEVGPFLGRALAAWTIATVALADEGGALEDPEVLCEAVALHSGEIIPWLRTLHEVSMWVRKGLPESLDDLFRKRSWLATQPFEVAVPRWWEDASPLVAYVHAHATPVSIHEPPPSRAPLRWARPRERARTAVARVIATTRGWVLAAVQDPMREGVLHSPREAFLLTLEELKQLMTGEWNRREQVRPHVEERSRTWDDSAFAELANAFPAEENGVVKARGWHAGWAIAALRGKMLSTENRSALSYGHLLATVVGAG